MALKQISLEYIEKKALQKVLRREIEIHSHLKHKNIVRLYGYFIEDNFVNIILEFCEKNNLKSLLEKKEKLPKEFLLKIFYGLTKGVYYLRERRIMHRDLKLENILLSK